MALKDKKDEEIHRKIKVLKEKPVTEYSRRKQDLEFLEQSRDHVEEALLNRNTLYWVYKRMDQSELRQRANNGMPVCKKRNIMIQNKKILKDFKTKNDEIKVKTIELKKQRASTANKNNQVNQSRSREKLMNNNQKWNLFRESRAFQVDRFIETRKNMEQGREMIKSCKIHFIVK